jgi:DNA mismatch repair protein MutL
MSNNTIKILPDFIANQIAAGEVVQRPESVVKELVENSLDAGATEIVVVVRNAGKSLIHIIDNGSGMSKEDIQYSIKRHATSKISSQSDLEAISTLGFRGEALASISSVSHLEIISRRASDDLGYKLIAQPNKLAEISEVNADKGTQILVKNLFYNVPARRKFLKSNLTEFKHISETMLKFSLSHPDKRFTFYNDDNLIFDLTPTDLENRIIETLGKAVEDLIIPLDFSDEGIDIKGFIGKPFLAKSNSSNQFLFLNNRIIKSKYINHAIVSCYEEMLEEKKFPFYVLFLNIDCTKIDINVHPQKHEVKFENDRQIYNIVKSAVLSTLRSVSLIPEFKIESEQNVNPFTIHKNMDEDDIIVNRNTGEILKQNESESNNHSNSNRMIDKGYKRPPEFRNDFSTDKFSNLFGSDEGSLFEYLTIDDRFLIVKREENLLVIYKRRAIQRIYYEKFVSSYLNNDNKSQDLLFPLKLKLEKRLINVLNHNVDNLKSYGFIFEISEETLVLESVPEIVQNTNLELLIERIATNLLDAIHDENDETYEFLAKVMSISLRVKQQDYRTSTQLEKLYNDLFKCKNPQHSPTGKLTSYTISYSELEKKFRL